MLTLISYVSPQPPFIFDPIYHHDDAHDAFMALPPYTCSREGLTRQLRSGPNSCRVGLGVRKYAPCYFNMLAHHEMALTCLQPVFV